MKTETVTVTDKYGVEVQAELAICPECGESEFHVYSISGHLPLQCTECDNTVCDGSCIVQPN